MLCTLNLLFFGLILCYIVCTVSIQMHNPSNIGSALWGSNGDDAGHNTEYFIEGIELDVDRLCYSVLIDRVCH